MNNRTKPKDAVVHKPKECPSQNLRAAFSKKNGGDGPAKYASLPSATLTQGSVCPNLRNSRCGSQSSTVINQPQETTTASNQPQQATNHSKQPQQATNSVGEVTPSH